MSGYVTGAAVVGMKFDGGVLLAADTKYSYGRQHRVRDAQRIQQLSADSIFCASGDAADQQFLTELLQAVVRREMLDNNNDAGSCRLDAESLHNYLSRVFYARRSKMNPLYNSAVVAGHSRGVPFLGYSDLYGTKYEDDFIVTGMGKYFAIGPLREKHSVKMSRAEARNLALGCMKLLFLRDCSAGGRIQIAYVTDRGVEFEEPLTLDTEWSNGPRGHYLGKHEQILGGVALLDGTTNLDGDAAVHVASGRPVLEHDLAEAEVTLGGEGDGVRRDVELDGVGELVHLLADVGELLGPQGDFGVVAVGVLGNAQRVLLDGHELQGEAHHAVVD
ncbi:proteasome subunit beta type-4 [Babesia caballi]|uniref:proteasome endopeptidase complex n=1 Tax=Babesia caballi TaxID=5871 RepID=A0AAV4LYP9_BABCB|nr:proteasome subunit beta type-4 [Babesia caballi]